MFLSGLLTACSPSPRSGYVSLYEAPVQPTGSVFELRAQFEDVPLADIPAGTIPGGGLLLAASGCVLLDPDAYDVTFFDGGPLSIVVDGQDPVTEESERDAYRTQFQGPSAAAGASIQLSLAGSDSVPAVDAALDAPAALGVDLPASVPRDADWVLSWDPALDADLVELQFGDVLCEAPASAGNLTVDAALLAGVPEGALPVWLSATRATEQAAEGVEVTFRVGETIVDTVSFE